MDRKTRKVGKDTEAKPAKKKLNLAISTDILSKAEKIAAADRRSVSSLFEILILREYEQKQAA